jgi:hypothetical protein
MPTASPPVNPTYEPTSHVPSEAPITSRPTINGETNAPTSSTPSLAPTPSFQPTVTGETLSPTAFSSPESEPTLSPSSNHPTQELTGDAAALCGMITSTNIGLIARDVGLSGWDCGGSGADSICTGWTGVTCSNGKVSGLSFSGMGLAGILSESFGQLVHLKSADLSDNDIQGPLPESFRNLINLEVLNLSGNQLGVNQEGTRASENGGNRRLGSALSDADILSSLTQLKVLDVSGNGYTGPIPASMCAVETDSLTLTALDEQSRSNPNTFSCVPLCLTAKSNVFGIDGLTVCGAEPSAAPTGFSFTKNSSSSKSPNAALSVLIYPAIAFVVLVFCCAGLVYFCVNKRKNTEKEDGKGDNKDSAGDRNGVEVCALDLEGQQQSSSEGQPSPSGALMTTSGGVILGDDSEDKVNRLDSGTHSMDSPNSTFGSRTPPTKKKKPPSYTTPTNASDGTSSPIVFKPRSASSSSSPSPPGSSENNDSSDSDDGIIARVPSRALSRSSSQSSRIVAEGMGTGMVRRGSDRRLQILTPHGSTGSMSAPHSAPSAMYHRASTSDKINVDGEGDANITGVQPLTLRQNMTVRLQRSASMASARFNHATNFASPKQLDIAPIGSRSVSGGSGNMSRSLSSRIGDRLAGKSTLDIAPMGSLSRVKSQKPRVLSLEEVEHQSSSSDEGGTGTEKKKAHKKGHFNTDVLNLGSFTSVPSQRSVDDAEREGRGSAETPDSYEMGEHYLMAAASDTAAVSPEMTNPIRPGHRPVDSGDCEGGAASGSGDSCGVGTPSSSGDDDSVVA